MNGEKEALLLSYCINPLLILACCVQFGSHCFRKGITDLEFGEEQEQ